MKIAILGATRGMGRSLARGLGERGDSLFLLGRKEADLQRSAEDISIRGKSGPIKTALCDLASPQGFDAALDAAEAELGGLDCVIVTAGLFKTQDDLVEDPAFLERMLQVNFTGTILFCEAARKRLLAGGGGTLCVFSSVAGDRGRKPVILYGSSKAGLSYYLEGLDHRYRSEGLKTICVKPGFVKTGMTAGLKPPPFAGEPDAVAQQVIKALDKGTPVVYTPPIWRWVMLVIKLLPRFIMRKIGF